MTQDTDIKNVTVGFIGFGNMAQGIAKGLVNGGVLDGAHIVANSGHFDKAQKAAGQIGARATHDAQETVDAADVVVIAVKPNQIETALAEVTEALADDAKLVVSIAAGRNLDYYQSLLGGKAHVQCVIPNTPIEVGQGILVTENANTLTDTQRAVFEALFSPIALIERVDTPLMDIGSSVAGCAPAFTAIYIEALADAGVKYGLKRETAYRLAAKMTEGVGALYMATGTNPGAMKDAVCSPGGTTIKGVTELEKQGFRGAVISGVDAIQNG
ncbi:pyrroline-5-carboxylate reductase [Bifidobacterium sp. ESL0790]|uniref:pyrroline-5-carboxylate reductase n=1 Tax=Bifidobacterium sp. ESL0790 TaxID=2983233 RepID=UPI0023F7E65F|nr:pyrroline-5-carboxylate reductase [Bifidobacterium sp. ESL0790]WEV72981.1 pyrroline-5-carboxylate reductase [Bifidobacterium sp. ESL0790]